jgi:hypothetical protein
LAKNCFLRLISVKIETFFAIFEKKVRKSFGGSEKSRTFAPAKRETAFWNASRGAQGRVL